MSCPPSVFWPGASPASPGFRWVGAIFLDLRRQLRRFLFGRFYFRFHRTKGLCNLKWNSIFGGIKYLLSLVQIPFTRTAENIISCHWNVDQQPSWDNARPLLKPVRQLFGNPTRPQTLTNTERKAWNSFWIILNLARI